MFYGGEERGALALIMFGLCWGPITNRLTFDDFPIRVTVCLGEPQDINSVLWIKCIQVLLEQCGEVLSTKISNSEAQMRGSQPTQESRCTKVQLLKSSLPSLPNRLIPQSGYIRIVSA